MSDQSPPAGPPPSPSGAPDPTIGHSDPLPSDPTAPGPLPSASSVPGPSPSASSAAGSLPSASPGPNPVDSGPQPSGGHSGRPDDHPGHPGYPGGAGGYPGLPGGYPAPVAYGWYPPAAYQLDPSDPLVTPPGAGIEGWVERCVAVSRRGWRLLLPILLLTQVLPAAVLSALGLAIDPTARWQAQLTSDSDALPPTFLADLAGFLAVLIGGSLIMGLVQCVGWAAGTWVIARQAVGAPADLGAALRYGLRRALGLWGWALIISLVVTVGFCLCLLPGVYAAFALALAGPVYLFERQDPIGRAHRMLRHRPGLVLGRVAVVFAIVIAVSVVGSIVESTGITLLGTTPFDSPYSAAVAVLVIVGAAVLALPAHLAQLVGLVVGYAEQRGHEGPVNSAQLAAELD